MKWKFWQREPKEPKKEYRMRVCNKGSIFGGGETPWYDAPDHPGIIHFREMHENLVVKRECNHPWHELEFHNQHLLFEEREVGAS